MSRFSKSQQRAMALWLMCNRIAFGVRDKASASMDNHTYDEVTRAADEVMDTIDRAIDGRIFRSAEDAIECILAALEDE